MGLNDSKISFYASSQCLGKGITSLCCPSGTHVFASRGGQCNEGLLPSIGKKKNEWLYRWLPARLLCSIHIAVLLYCTYFFHIYYVVKSRVPPPPMDILHSKVEL